MLTPGFVNILGIGPFVRVLFGTKNEAFDVQWGFRYLCTTSYWQLGNFAETILVLQSVSVVTL